jgi:hypothetical protein
MQPTRRSTPRLLAFVLALSISACTEQYLPEFKNPQPITVPSGKPAYGPRLSQGDGDGAFLSWMERNDDGIFLRYSVLDQGSWLPAITVVQDEKMFVNWADLPGITPLEADSLLAHWLSYTADAPYAYQILTAFSADGGATWSAPGSPHTDGTPTEHGFVSAYPAENGVGLVWLDGRKTPDEGMTLRGATLATDGGLSDESLLDDLVCDCCQTDVAETDGGPIAIYRNRTDDEVRDIYTSRLLDGKWQPGTPVSDDGWVISGCPVNGPSIAATGDLVVVAWFTNANNEPKVQAAISRNSGKSFSEPVEIASKGASGHVGISLIDKHSYVVSWMESDKDGTHAINLRAQTFNGQMGRVRTVGRTSVARTVPQMVLVGDKLILAWTDEMNDLSKVVSVKVPILGFYD